MCCLWLNAWARFPTDVRKHSVLNVLHLGSNMYSTIYHHEILYLRTQSCWDGDVFLTRVRRAY